MNTAIEIKRLDWRGDARVYRLSEPLEGFSHVIVSAVTVSFMSPLEGFLGGSGGPETYIFGCNKKGEKIDWKELEGSFKGGLDHARALRGARYEIGE